MKTTLTGLGVAALVLLTAPAISWAGNAAKQKEIYSQRHAAGKQQGLKVDPGLLYGRYSRKPVTVPGKGTQPTDPDKPQNWIGGPKIGPGGEIIYW